VVRLLGRFQLRLAGLAIIAMMLVTVVDVVMRYAFNRPVRGAYDFTEAMLVVFVFNSMSACFLARAHIVIDLIDGLIGPRAKNALVRFGDVVSVALLILFAYTAIVPAIQAFEGGERKLELGLPLWTLWAVALAGLATAVICAVGALFMRGSRDADDGAKL
jgi:TRAP-type C4-dicarboxylate transport system permease small subunit